MQVLLLYADIEIEVIRGYISNPEQAAIMDILDNRYDTHTLGVAMQIRYKNGTGDAYTTHRLAQKAVEQCSPIFNYSTSDSEAVGIGIYKDSVFVDIRDIFDLWVEKTDYIPTGFASLEAYQDFMEERAQLANSRLFIIFYWVIILINYGLPVRVVYEILLDTRITFEKAIMKKNLG